MSMRIELFVEELTWKKSNVFSQEFLFTFICVFGERIAKMILFWNDNRVFLNDVLLKENKLIGFFEENPFYILMNKESQNNLEIVKKELSLDRNQMIKHFKEIRENNEKNKEFYFFNPTLNKEEISLTSFSNKKDNLVSYLEKNLLKDNTIVDKIYSLNQRFNISTMPMYIISTRDCFVFDLIVKESEVKFENKTFLKKEFFFDKNNVPSNFAKFKTSPDDFRVGVITYENFFSHDELCEIEKLIEKTEEHSLQEIFLPETAQKTLSGEKLKRTKFFFGSRYMWTKKQLAEPNSYVAAGIRKDVSPPPFWIKNKVEDRLVKAGVMLKDFINSYALNVYHDGSEGLGQHFDDAVRFKQPIYTLRTFSDCRLSFGSQLYGFCNGAFTIPLPRGCICVMEGKNQFKN